jgi:hypothetical protein
VAGEARKKEPNKIKIKREMIDLFIIDTPMILVSAV